MHFGTVGCRSHRPRSATSARAVRPPPALLRARIDWPRSWETELKLTYHDSPESLVAVCDVVNLQTAAVSVHRARVQRRDVRADEAWQLSHQHGARQAVWIATPSCERSESGRLAGYAGDVWFPQPAPADHPWRRMPFQRNDPHISGTSLSAQARYAGGHAGDPSGLLRRAAHSAGVSNRRTRQAGRHRRPIVQADLTGTVGASTSTPSSMPSLSSSLFPRRAHVPHVNPWRRTSAATSARTTSPEHFGGRKNSSLLVVISKSHRLPAA